MRKYTKDRLAEAPTDDLFNPEQFSMMAWDLEDWITDTGANLLDKRLQNPESLSTVEQLVYEIWLLDTEARNGGLSQYFCHHGLDQWQRCVAIAALERLESFAPFAHEVETRIAGSADPYETLVSGGAASEDLWFHYQSGVVQQVRDIWQHSGG